MQEQELAQASYDLPSQDQIAYGARILERLRTSLPSSASTSLLDAWTRRGNNLALIEPFSFRCYEATIVLTKQLEGYRDQTVDISKDLFRQSCSPLQISVTTSIEAFADQITASSLRWEAVGFYLVAITRAAGDFATIDGLYETDQQRSAFQKSIMHLSDSLLDMCLSLDCLNDLQLMLQYENFVLHSVTDGDQSYQSWRRLGDVISSLYALGYHRQGDVQVNVPNFLQELRIGAFARTYSADKNVSIFLGRPPRLHRRYCQFRIPNSKRIMIKGSDRRPLQHPINWTDHDTFSYVTDTKWAAICAILKADLLDILEEDDRDNRRQRTESVIDCARLQWSALPQHLRLEQPLRYHATQPFERDLLVGTKLNYLHTLFLAQLALVNRVSDPSPELVTVSAEILNLVAEATLLKGTLANSGTSLVWKVAYYGLAAAGMICLAILNPLRHAASSLSMSRVVQDLQVIVAQVETGALVHFQDANYALLDAATRTIKSLIDRAITGKLPQRAEPTTDISTDDLPIENDPFMSTWGQHDLQDFEADFWVNLSEHPFLIDPAELQAGVGATAEES
ncbi:hypothetical protein CAC42_4368 [Sphaceloma murrayae]|uniref:Transcription factor domain-containing protein n=1 Tax=Sphaceloma murrayae TaxID=2082308 RepID=A0A2K1QLE4_9PEZI|nr:hypothetical protein CAC42_4368 [Sphaceloma murrayae]